MNAEVNARDRLIRRFPDKKICYDDYQILKRDEKLWHELYNMALHDGIDTTSGWSGRKAWLKLQGFTFADVERDMSREAFAPGECQIETLEDLIDFAYNKVALLGEVIVPENLCAELEVKGQWVFDQLIRHNQVLTPFEQRLLVFHMVQNIQSWDADEEVADTKFWKRIFSSYGASNLSQNSQKPYLTLCSLIKCVLEQNTCYFVPTENSKRYYVSLMTHALAPKSKTTALLRILFDFYAKSLQYQYSADDQEAFVIFVNSLKSRWNENIQAKEEIRSDVVSPGIKTLTENRKQYMISLCNTLVGKIDAVISGNCDFLHPELLYWDKLIVDWYSDYAPYERAQQKRIRAGSTGEFVARRRNQIQVQYNLDQEKHVGIQIPAIRYDCEYNSVPVVKVYHKECLVDENIKLRLFRDEEFHILKSSRMVIPLLQYRKYLNDDFSFRVEIWTDGELYYSTEQKLNCSWICFDEDGKVCEPAVDACYLLLPYNCDLECEDDALERMSSDTELYWVEFSRTDRLFVNGIDLFSRNGKKQKLRCVFSTSATQNAEYINSSDEAPVMIYAHSTMARIQFLEEKQWESYKLYQDGVELPIVRYVQNGNVNFDFIPDGGVHTVQLIEFLSGRIVYEKKYLCILGFEVKRDRPVYLDEPNLVELSIPAIELKGKTFQTYPPKQFVDIPYRSGHIRVKLPAVFGSFLGENIFEQKEWSLWYEDIPQNAVLQLKLPDGWHHKARLGSRELAFSSAAKGYEVGNFLKTYNAEERESVHLFVDIFQDGVEKVYQTCDLAKICFKEQFLRPPFEIRDDALIWNAGDNYIGTRGKEKYIYADLSVIKEQPWTYTLRTDRSECVEARFVQKVSEGEYPYSVYLEKEEKKKSIFGVRNAESKIELIGNYSLIVGDPNSFRFRNKCLKLTFANCWNERVTLRENMVRITELQYLGDTISSDDQSYPCYQGTLEFWSSYGFWKKYNSDVVDRRFAPLNPISVWIKSDRELLIAASNEQDIIVDSQYGTIWNKREETLKSEDRKRGRLPDSFNYTVEVDE